MPSGSAAARAGRAAFEDLVTRLIHGYGPDGDARSPGSGARICVNMAAVHIPGFCAAPTGRPAYLNAYDREAQGGKAVSALRRDVDRALPLRLRQKPESTYFGAVELTGCGIRFYGDVCLILRPDARDGGLVVLDRNSYDLVRLPLSQRVADLVRTRGLSPAQARRRVAAELSGTWRADLAAMAAVKIADALQPRERRLTVGVVAAGILQDEDYLEVLRDRSFTAADLQEARVTGLEAGAEAQIGDRLRHGPVPTHAELLWRDQRRRAARALGEAGVPTHIVTTSGRTRA
jgi:hypothetical protein